MLLLSLYSTGCRSEQPTAEPTQLVAQDDAYLIADRINLENKNPYPTKTQGIGIESELIVLALLGDTIAERALDLTAAPFGDIMQLESKLDSALSSVGVSLLSSKKLSIDSATVLFKNPEAGYEIEVTLGGQLDTTRWIQILKSKSLEESVSVHEVLIKWTGRLPDLTPKIISHEKYEVDYEKYQALDGILNSSEYWAAPERLIRRGCCTGVYIQITGMRPSYQVPTNYPSYQVRKLQRSCPNAETPYSKIGWIYGLYGKEALWDYIDFTSEAQNALSKKEAALRL